MRVRADDAALADLDVFLARAERADPGGAARLLGRGDLLAVMVCPVRGAGMPTAVAVRALTLGEPLTLDVTLDLVALRHQLAARQLPPALRSAGATGALASWAGTLPPRGGWTPVDDPSVLDPALLEAARRAAGLLGFVRPGHAERYAHAGPWTRLATTGGDVVARLAPALDLAGGGRREVRSGHAATLPSA